MLFIRIKNLTPITSSSVTQGDVVGTFGYLAPEYFMYGKVSDKIDVYAFGVVLLELLSGRKPIGYETPKGHESLVMWVRDFCIGSMPCVYCVQDLYTLVQ